MSVKDVLKHDSSGLVSTDVIGSLHRELIRNFGAVTARAILMRVGFQCGRDAAAPVKGDSSSLIEKLSVQDLQGLARIHIVEKNDLDRPGLEVSGEWLDSSEGAQHLRTYGVGNGTACWAMEGYAAGYATEFLGREMTCLETGCIAKGNPVCTFELYASGDSRPGALRPGGEAPFRCLNNISSDQCQLQATSFDWIVTTDANGIITSCSQAASELLGLLPEDAIGRSFSSFLVGCEQDEKDFFDLVKAGGRIRGRLTEMATAAGGNRPVVLAASAIRSASGVFMGTVTVIHDLTDVRRLEDELASKNRFMANILRDSADAIITMDPNDIVTSWNKGAELMFGYSADEVIGRSIQLIIPPELLASRELDGLAQKFRAQGAVPSYQTERVTKDGRRIHVIVTRTAIRDDAGVVIGSSSVVKDITSHMNLEKQLASTEHFATLGELSAGLAHEIKNPLAGIKGAIEVIRDSMSPTDMHREVLGDVLHEVNRIDNTVKDLLSYAKPRPPSHTTILLSEMADRITAIARQSAKRRNQTIEIRKLTSLPHFTGDDTQLEQVLLNLLLNAQNAISEGGHIEVVLSYEAQLGEVRIEVIDDGPGIPADIIGRIFQPFFTTRTDGTGLGLATCLKNVQYHGGDIEVHSAPGRGTRFMVTIPLFCQI